MNNISFNDKCIINFKILYMLLRKQFFLRNKFLFIILPLIISGLIVKYSTIIWLFTNENISLIVTIISLIWWILLNFLVLILQDDKSILYVSWIKEPYWELKWKYNDDFTIKMIKVSYFEFIYHKIFFIIILSIIFVIFFIFKQLGLFNFVLDNKVFGFDIVNYKKWIVHFPYVLFIIFYFINVLYLFLKLSFLLQNNKK